MEESGVRERQRPWHFIERNYTQSHGGPLYKPLKKTVHFNVKQSFAVQEGSLALLQSLQLDIEEVFELSSSVPVKRFEFEVAKATGPFLLH